MVIEQIFTKYIYKQLKLCYNSSAKQNQITFKDKRPIFIGCLISIPIFASQIKSGKNACSADLHLVFIREVGFVWRQLESAFFGAVTLVAALFI